MHRHLFVLLSGLLAAFPATLAFALVSDCTDTAMCGTGSGACTITTTINIEPGSELDCGGRDLTIANNGALKVTDGDFTLLADDLTLVGPGGLIYAVEGTDEEPGEITIDLTGNLNNSGKIRANGDHGGGTISIKVLGNVSMPENGTDGIEADGTAAHASGGEISIEAGGSISVYDPIHAEGASSGENGGGTIEIRAGGDIILDQDGHISVPGRSEGGGRVSITSTGGDILVREHIVVEGRSESGNGGEVELSAADRIEISEYIHGRGGVNVGGGKAAGGQIRLEAGCGGVIMNANGDIDLAGGELGAGEDSGAFVIDSAGPVTLASGVTIDTHARASGGNGGEVSIRSRGTLTVNGSTLIDARGNSASGGQGRGGVVELSGCMTDIKASAVVDVRGYEGGAIRVYGQNYPSDTGTQPVTVRDGATLRSAGTASVRNGELILQTHFLRQGVCSNNNAVPCWTSGTCTAGCQTATCVNANPNSEGKATQFDIAVARSEVPGMGSSCAAACQ